MGYRRARILRGIFLRLAVLLFVLSTAACLPAPAPQLTAREIAQKSAERMTAISTFHFNIEVAGRRKAIDPLGTLILRRAEGDVARPDRAQSKIRVALSGVIVEVEAVGIGNRQWLTNPLTRRWEEAPKGWGYNPAVLFDAQIGLASLLKRVEGLTRATDESLDGKSHYRLTGRIAGNEIAPMTAYMVTGSDVSFTLWVGADDFILRKVHIVEKDAGDSDATEWDILLSQFDKPVRIEQPPLP